MPYGAHVQCLSSGREFFADAAIDERRHVGPPNTKSRVMVFFFFTAGQKAADLAMKNSRLSSWDGDGGRCR